MDDKLKQCRGIILDNGAILYYENAEDFQDAWPGIKMMLAVQGKLPRKNQKLKCTKN